MVLVALLDPARYTKATLYQHDIFERWRCRAQRIASRQNSLHASISLDLKPPQMCIAADMVCQESLVDLQGLEDGSL